MQYTKLTYFEKVIHEMSTPIQTIYLLSELMLQKQMDFTKVNEENLYHIHNAAGKLTKILSMLSSMTNLKVNKIAVNFMEVDLISLVQQEIKYQQVRNKYNLDLKIDLINKVQNLIIKVDKFWFEQLLANLIINAVNHCEKGTIEVCTAIARKNDRDYFSLSVIDEGCGIADSELETIFLPLERGTHSIGTIPGSGIGLAIAKEIVQAHGGNIVAKNNEKGGATFEVMIPLEHLREDGY